MKRKGLYGLALAVTLSMLVGCGTTADEGMENPQNLVTEAVTATPEPTATPAPTAAPMPQNYMEQNGIRVLGAGLHEYRGFKYRELDENGLPIMEVDACEAVFEVSEEDNGNGTKTIYATIYAYPYVYADGTWSVNSMTGFVDLQTGKSFLPYATDVTQTTYLSRDDKKIELTLTAEVEFVSVTCPYNIGRYTLVCPSDYEDAGFYMTGYKNTEAVVERAGAWKVLDYINHGESELVVFGVKEGLATESEKKQADGAELAEKNYFEANGFSVKGEGEYTWKGMDVLRRQNAETGRWESVSLEESEITTLISTTEEFLGDGTKQIKYTLTEEFQRVSESEVKVPYSKYGVVDKETGLVYPPRTYNLADSYVLEKNDEVFSISVGLECLEEDLGDGKWKATTTFTLVCPEDYNDAVLYLTADVEINEDEDVNWSERNVFSLNDIQHGECELLFFQ